MLVSHRKRFIFTKTMKTAGTSVEAYFEPWCMPEGEWQPTHGRDQSVSDAGIIGARGQAVDREGWYSHMHARAIRDKLGRELWDDYFKFTIVRNPFDKLISRFFMVQARKEGKDLKSHIRSWWAFDDRWLPLRRRDVITRFRNWVRRGGTINDSPTYLIDGEFCLDHFIRYESLHEGMKEVCEKIGVEYDKAKLPEYKRGWRDRSIPIADFYDNSTRKIVESRFAKELEEFDYQLPE